MITNRRNAAFVARIVTLSLGAVVAGAACSGGDGGAPATGGSGSGVAGTGGGTAGTGAGTAGTGGTIGTAGTGGSATAGTGGGATAGTGGGATAGTGGTIGTAGTGGSATAGTGGGTAGTGGGTAGTGGAATAGAGGATAGSGGRGGGAGGVGGSSGGGGGAGRGGGGGTSSGGSGGGAGGATSCAGHAISLSANGTGTASDAARARVMVDLMTDLPIGNANRTLEYWAYIKTTDWVGESNTMFEYGNQGATAAGWGMDFGTSAVTGMTGNHATLDPYTNGGFDGDSTSYLGITSATAAQWVHIAMTWNGTTFQTYINGAPRIAVTATGSTTRLATAQTQLTIGCNNPRFSCFNGYIDEFRVWNVARSATDIMNNYSKTLVGNEAGLVGYWKFDETSGTNAADSVTAAGHTARPGTLMANNTANVPTFVVSTAPISCP